MKMRCKKYYKLVTTGLFMTMLGITSSVQAAGVELSMGVEEEIEIISESGKHTLKRVEATSIVPGDTVVYTITYHNKSDKVATDVVITNPVPEHTVYVADSAKGGEVTFSVDHGKSYAAAGKLKVKNNSGKSVAASAEHYSNVRWLLPSVKAGEKGTVIFKAKLN